MAKTAKIENLKTGRSENGRWPFFAKYLEEKNVDWEENPFNECDFKREGFADNIINLVESYKAANRGAVIGIDAGWGYGKSTFMDMLGAKIENQDFTVVPFNAWETDFASNPLLAFVAEFANETKQSLTFQEAKNALYSIIDSVADVGAGIAVKTPSLEAQIAGYTHKMGKAAMKAIHQQVHRAYLNEKKLFKDFDAKLRKLAGENLKQNGKPIVILIDELDRCRPNYAIELLENIKHFFNVPGIVFLLAVNKPQLEQSFKHVYYGSNNVNEQLKEQEPYFEKFVDIFINLPQPKIQSLLKKELEGYDEGQDIAFFPADLPSVPSDVLSYMLSRLPSQSYRKSKGNSLVGFSYTPRKAEKLSKEITLLLQMHGKLCSPWHLYILAFVVCVGRYGQIERAFKYKDTDKKELTTFIWDSPLDLTTAREEIIGDLALVVNTIGPSNVNECGSFLLAVLLSFVGAKKGDEKLSLSWVDTYLNSAPHRLDYGTLSPDQRINYKNIVAVAAKEFEIYKTYKSNTDNETARALNSHLENKVFMDECIKLFERRLIEDKDQ